MINDIKIINKIIQEIENTSAEDLKKAIEEADREINLQSSKQTQKNEQI